jgi:hypothetical protein
VFGPHAADRRGGFEEEDGSGGMDLVVGFEGGQATPSYTILVDAEECFGARIHTCSDHGHVHRLHGSGNGSM